MIKLESNKTCEEILDKMQVQARKPRKPQQPLYNHQLYQHHHIVSMTSSHDLDDEDAGVDAETAKGKDEVDSSPDTGII